MAPDADPARGRIEVEVPHWAAAVTVCDKELRPVIELDTVRENADRPGVYEATGEVAPGIYQVEVTLGGQRRRHLVGVVAGQTARLPRELWRLDFSSVAPLAGIAAAPEAHRAAAERMSRRTTWDGSPGGNSRLFVFVRTTAPARFPRFAEGLQLLDAGHRPVVDLGTAARTNAEQGWLAFSGRLPAGYYILRRGRPGVPVRYQPVYLHAEWETQVFLAARAYPSLRLLSLAMAPDGAGFRADDDTVMAAETILESLQRPGDDTPITSNEKLVALLQRGHDNPWLDVLAAYSLWGWRERVNRPSRNDGADGGGAGSVDVEMAALLRRLVGSVGRIGDHPDARAVRIGDTDVAPQPFWYPPLVRAGLLRVQRNATRHAGTIPLDSLTDCVLDNQVTNAVWTAWRVLDRKPRSEHPTPAGVTGRPMIEIRPVAESAADPSPVAAFGQAVPMATTSYAHAVGPGERPESDEPAADDGPARATSAPGRVDNLLLAPIVTAAQALIADQGFAALPERLPLTPARDLDELLAQLRPEAISAASGLPLARTQLGLQQLRDRIAEDPGSASAPPARPLPAIEREILHYAFAKARPPLMPSPPPESAPGDSPRHESAPNELAQNQSAPDESAPDPAIATVASPATVAAVIGGLRTEEDRLRHRADDVDWVEAGGDAGTAGVLAARLRRVADELLTGVGFIVLTDPDDNVICGNAAFDDLISQSGGAQPGVAQWRRDNVLAWERALAGRPAGPSTLDAPASNRIAAQWELWRTVLTDAVDGRLHGYLNVLRGRGVAASTERALQQVNSALPDVRKYASLVAYGSAEYRGDYTQRLLALTSDMDAAVADA